MSDKKTIIPAEPEIGGLAIVRFERPLSPEDRRLFLYALTKNFGDRIRVVAGDHDDKELLLSIAPDDTPDLYTELSKPIDPELLPRLVSQLEHRLRHEPHTRAREDLDVPVFLRAMEADPVAMEVILKMERAGHQPAVFMEDGEYWVGTCAPIAPHQHVLFDSEAESTFNHLPQAIRRRSFLGNAVGIAEAIGASIMTEGQHAIVVESNNGKKKNRPGIDFKRFCWLATRPENREKGLALVGTSNLAGERWSYFEPETDLVDANSFERSIGVRLVVPVKKLLTR